MPTIEQQLDLEQRMIDAGAKAYLTAQRTAEEEGRGHELDYAHNLIKEFVTPLVTSLTDWLNKTGPGMYAASRVALRQIEPEKAIFIALRNLFSSFTRDHMPVEIANNIGAMIEDELKFTKFQSEHGPYYNHIINDFKQKGTVNYRHVHRVLTHKAKEKNIEWVAWTQKQKVDIGSRLLDLILRETDIATRVDRTDGKKNITTIVPSQESIQWIKDHESVRQFMHPERMPCIIKPDDWTDITQGGYYSPILRQSVPMIKVKGSQRTKKKVNLSKVMNSINALQHVEWAVNTDILKVLTDVWTNNLQIGLPSSKPLKPPPSPFLDRDLAALTEEEQAIFTDWKREAATIYLLDRERVSKTFQVARVVRMAQEFKAYDKFWYVWYADFRGRLYCSTAGLSPQGPDFAKALLKFSTGKRLGGRGLYWLKVHIANRFGFDKVSYDARVEWVDDQREQFMACANDPLSHRDIWANADKPYQFLAAIFEYAEAMQLSNPEDYTSHLPIGLDGSCNGLQNFSAMLRDAVGGAATNLTKQDVPSDIYKKVADVLIRKVKAILTDGQQYYTDKNGKQVDNWYYAQKWLQFGIDRKLAKRPVMTLPYGATRQSCTQYIFQELIKKDKLLFGQGHNFSAACWLTPLLWASIGEVVVAARQAMDWLQKAASILSKEDHPIEWTTADGFVVYQKMTVIETMQIDTQLAGRFQCRIGTWTDEIDISRQRNGVAPNFVHSMDATHMRMTINALVSKGITQFSFIHDDYGTYAADTDTMHEVIREQFVKLYEEHDPLQTFCDEQEARWVVLPSVPKKGELDLNEVMESPYFFG
jgi:DNA-directed RNA polymerase